MLGDELSAAVIQPDGRDRRRFEQMMVRLGHPIDRARAMSQYVAAVAGCEKDCFRLSDLARLPPGSVDVARDRFRHLLERATWSDEGIRRGLVRSAIDAGVLAVSVEIDVDAKEDESGRDMIALVAVGEGWSIPVGWTCIDYPPPIPGVPDAVRRAVVNVLEDFAADWHVLQPGIAPPPIVTADHCLGEDRELRGELRARSFEYALPVYADYDEVEPVRHPYADTERERTLAELLPQRPGETPAVVELAATERSEAEYAVALPDGGYVLIHPELALPASALSGHRPQRRARELSELRAPAPRVVRNLRVTDFLHGSPKGTIRHAWLMSAYAVVIRGRFIEEEEVLDR